MFKKKTLDIIPGQVDVIPGCDPSEKWLNGEMPSMDIEELIDHLDFRSSIHETYYGYVVQGILSPSSGYGDANFHLWAIEGYSNCTFYLKLLQEKRHDQIRADNN